jgi:propanol-preferring alcohol dehydrogenase
MQAVLFDGPGLPLRLATIPTPQPAVHQVLLKVYACAVCHTDLHILDGELSQPKLPLVLGHQIVGQVVQLGSHVDRFQVGDRVGVPWLGQTDGTCAYCLKGQENLCENPKFTGYTLDGGFAEYAVADQHFTFRLPVGYPDLQAAPLLCAGLIGYRTYRLAGQDIEKLGIFGFGAAAHLITQVAVQRGQQVYAFTRPGDLSAQQFALRMGAVWAGGSTQTPPVLLDAALIFAPVGSLVVAALKAVVKGGSVVCGGIHMSDIPAFPYYLLWEERILRSVANLTRQDGEEFLALAPQVPIQTEVHVFPLQEAQSAVDALRRGDFTGAAVLQILP